VLIDAERNGRHWPGCFANAKLQPNTPAIHLRDAETETRGRAGGIAFASALRTSQNPFLGEGKLSDRIDADLPPPWDLFIYRPQKAQYQAGCALVYDQSAGGIPRFAAVSPNTHFEFPILPGCYLINRVQQLLGSLLISRLDKNALITAADQSTTVTMV